MGFFPEPLPEVPADAVDDEEECPQPVWSGPPSDVRPGVLGLELMLAQSGSVAVFLSELHVYPQGVSMRLGVRARRSRHTRYEDIGDASERYMRGPAALERLAWGFELADGRRATSLDPSPWSGEASVDSLDSPDRPLLVARGGGGSSRHHDGDWWLWPLPPPGPLRVVCRWRREGIEEVVHELDGAAWLAAAERSQPLWPEA